MIINSRLLNLALYTALAASIHVIEGLVMRMLPVPFLRIGLSNVVVLYLLWKNDFIGAMIVSLAKVFLGGLITLTLLSPSTLLSGAGSISALLIMQLAQKLRLGFSIFGISIIGAICHNLAQLFVVRITIIQSSRVFMLTPILILIGLISGSIVAYLVLYANAKLTLPGIMDK